MRSLVHGALSSMHMTSMPLPAQQAVQSISCLPVSCHKAYALRDRSGALEDGCKAANCPGVCAPCCRRPAAVQLCVYIVSLLLLCARQLHSGGGRLNAWLAMLHDSSKVPCS